jgi:hypothetical protein
MASTGLSSFLPPISQDGKIDPQQVAWMQQMQMMQMMMMA